VNKNTSFTFKLYVHSAEHYAAILNVKRWKRECKAESRDYTRISVGMKLIS